VTLHNLPTSAELEQSIRERVAKLERLCARLTRCHVVVETPQRHAMQGKQFNVRLDMHLSGVDIAINRDSDSDVHIALSAAFDAAEHKLEEHRSRERAKAKTRREKV
jgi:ribosomal subunit interface protein